MVIFEARSYEDIDMMSHGWSISCEKVRGYMIHYEILMKRFTFYPMGCMWYDMSKVECELG